MDETSTFLTGSAVVVYLQRYLKTFGLYQAIIKDIPLADKWIHRGIAAIGALVIAVGIHTTLQGNATEGWKFLAEIPPLQKLVEGVFDFGRVFVMQQVIYDSTKGKV